jgi:hypothetical protein
MTSDSTNPGAGDSEVRQNAAGLLPENSPLPQAPGRADSSWREVLPIHKAAELFPLMSEAELRELGEDIKKHRQRVPVTIFQPVGMEPEQLLDGRNRLDAMELAGLSIIKPDGTLDDRVVKFEHAYADPARGGVDPFAYVLSANIHRRHLSAEQKRGLIAKLVMAKPELSDRQLGKMAKASKNTVNSVRAELEARGQVDHVEKRKDSKGRKQPAKKSKLVPKKTAKLEPVQVVVEDDAEASAEKRQAEYAAVSAPPTDMKAGAVEAHKWVTDTISEKFDGRVFRLLRMVKEAKPDRFAKSLVNAVHLRYLGKFFTDLAQLKADGAQ